MTVFLSMAAYALATSISPGPVNLVALSTGAQHGWRPSMRHVTGATAGFTLLLLLTGWGLQELLRHWPQLLRLIQWGGIAFLLYLAWKLASDQGQLAPGEPARRPSLLRGAAMQWLNPKAWLAATAGMGAYAADGAPALVLQFSAIYCVVCFGSIACWACAGVLLRQHLARPARVRLFNRLMAGLLAASALYLAS